MATINAVTFHEDPSVESIAEAVKSLGFDGIELSRPPFFEKLRTLETRRRFAAWMREIGLSMRGFDCWVDVLPFDHFDQTLEGFRRAVDWASELDLQMIISHDPWARDNGGRLPSECMAASVKLFREVARMCAAKNLSLVVEPHPDTLSMEDAWAMEFIDALESPNVGLVYDCCHYGVGQPRTYLRAIENLAQRIRHIHLSDSDCQTYALHLPPGDGKLALNDIVAALKSTGFDGSLTCDMYGYPLPADGARRSIERVRAVENELGIHNTSAFAPRR